MNHTSIHTQFIMNPLSLPRCTAKILTYAVLHRGQTCTPWNTGSTASSTRTCLATPAYTGCPATYTYHTSVNKLPWHMYHYACTILILFHIPSLFLFTTHTHTHTNLSLHTTHSKSSYVPPWRSTSAGTQGTLHGPTQG